MRELFLDFPDLSNYGLGYNRVSKFHFSSWEQFFRFCTRWMVIKARLTRRYAAMADYWFWNGTRVIALDVREGWISTPSQYRIFLSLRLDKSRRRPIALEARRQRLIGCFAPHRASARFSERETA